MEGIKQSISLDENNKLIIKGAAVISNKGAIPSFDGEFVMCGEDVQRLLVLLNEGNYLRREEVQLSIGDRFRGCYGWSTFAVVNDEQVAEMLKMQETTIEELRKREKLLSDDVKARMECEKTLTAKIDMLEAERKALKKGIEELEFTIKTLDALNGADDLEVLKDVTSECFDDFKSALKRFFGRFKKKK